MKEKKEKKDKQEKKSKKRGKGLKLLLLLPILALILFVGARAMNMGGYASSFAPAQTVQNFFVQYDAKQALQSILPQGKNSQQAAAVQQNGQQAANDQQQNSQVFGKQERGQQSGQVFNKQDGQLAKDGQRGFHKGGMEHGKRGFEQAGFAHGGHHGGFAKFLIAAGFIILGWFLRRGAEDSTWKKWTGWALFVVGVVMLVPVPVLIIAAIVYWLYKKWTASRTEEWVEAPFVQDMQTETSNAAKLDEWERSISKEDK